MIYVHIEDKKNIDVLHVCMYYINIISIYIYYRTNEYKKSCKMYTLSYRQHTAR